MKYEREQVSILLGRLREKPRTLIYITGPRQSGKTTLVRQALRKIGRPHRYRLVDDPESDAAFPETGRDLSFGARKNEEWLVRAWEEARAETRRSEQGFILVLDEIHAIPDWSRTVKGLWDMDRLNERPLHVVLLASAPLLMRQDLRESLTGRFESLYVPHWSFAEMSEAFGFNLEQYLYFGGYPGAAPYIGDAGRWRGHVNKAMIEPSIERDILMLQRIHKPALLKQAFELAARCSGQILSYRQMQGQLADAGNTTTLAHYLDLLAKTSLIESLPLYSSSFGHWRRHSPKLNVLNTALVTACAPHSFAAARSDRRFWGRLVESAVGAHLSNTKEFRMRLSYWRRNGGEVDFVLNFDQKLFAVEVKSGRIKSRRGLDAFRKNYKKTTQVAIGPGGVPLEKFLSTSAETLFENL